MSQARSARSNRHRGGQDVRAWPLVTLLLLVVIGAITCVLWFMREAVQNTRLAVRQRLVDAYRGQLVLVQRRVDEQWRQHLGRFDQHAAGPALFALAVGERWADSVICFDDSGQPVYPHLRDSRRSAEASAGLLELERSAGDLGSGRADLAATLQRRVASYETAELPSPQRRFLMRELQRLVPGASFPTQAAEELAARYLETHSPGAATLAETMQPTKLPGIWAGASTGRRLLAVYTGASLREKLEALIQEPSLSSGIRLSLASPGDLESDPSLATVALSANLPGWRLVLSVDDHALFDTAADRKVTAYVWTGSIVIAAMSVIGLILARTVGRQVRLARLKNDLLATVSHELKTPLTAMRAIVETLLDAEKFDEATTREYIEMLARENVRLSRLIDNFLTFSRLDRNQFHFTFEPVAPTAIVDDALAAFGDRRHREGCRFETFIEPGLQPVQGDRDALAGAIVNLLDNSWKYTGDEKRISLRVLSGASRVRFVIEDNGIGIPAGENRRIFQRFYQVDQRLARTVSGCGLGLSIVQAIVAAHGGTVTVQSEVDHGSTFTIEIPITVE